MIVIILFQQKKNQEQFRLRYDEYRNGMAFSVHIQQFQMSCKCPDIADISSELLYRAGMNNDFYLSLASSEVKAIFMQFV